MKEYKFKKKWDEMTKDEKLVCIRYFPEEAKGDKDWIIRLEAYRKLGYTEEAKQDDDWLVRLEAYRELGYTEEAKHDEQWVVRQEAELFFSLINDDSEKDEVGDMKTLVGQVESILAEVKEKISKLENNNGQL